MLGIFQFVPFPFGYSVSKRLSCGKDFDWLAGLLMLLFTHNIPKRKGYLLITIPERKWIRIEGYQT